ncbi:hypothetical protein D9V84_10720 [Bacteroidetes/Chlorobi group bacterium Naka2016]|nr:MAG: hypothetical protein D9V84_10720 [Bacteroidetes/Chlorobi group bacterium Naka2016]
MFRQKRIILFQILSGLWIGSCQSTARIISILFAVFLLYLLSPTSSNSETFNLTPLSFNFNGATACGNIIICYGNMGQYFISTNRGISWEQKSIGEFDEIYKIVNFNDTLWGITSANTIIISSDCGNTWEENIIPLDSGDMLTNILVTDFGIYIRTKTTLQLFDKGLKKTNEIKDEILYVSENQYIDPGLPYSFSEFDMNNFFFVYEKLIVECENLADKGFLLVDKNLSSYKVIDLRDKIIQNRKKYGFYPPNFYGITNLHYFKGQPILQINGNLYFIDSTFAHYQYFFQDTLFMNTETNPSSPKWYEFGNPFTYFFHNDSLYMLFLKSNDLSNKKYNIFGIKKYISNPDTFVQVGNSFIDTYYTHYYDFYNKKYGIVNNVSFKMFSMWPYLLFDSLLIFPKENRTLVITRNFGNDWELISYLRGKPRLIINDSIYFFINHWGNDEITEIYKTSDGGLSFIPAKNFREGYKSAKDIPYSTFSLFYIDSNGKGFAKGHQRWDPQILTISDDAWDSFDSKILENFKLLSYQFNGFSVEQFTSNVSKFNNFYFFTKSDTISQWWNIGYRTWVCYLDTSFNNYNEKLVDTLSAALYILPQNLYEFIAFSYVNNPLNYRDFHFEIKKYQKFDSVFIFKTLHRLNVNSYINQIYEHNPDSVFITFKEPDKVYLYDRTRDTLQLLWQPETDDGQNPLLMVISDRFYLVGKGLFLENTDRSDLTQWREGKWDYGKPNFESVIFKGNVAIAGLSDSLRPFNYYKITLRKETPTTVESEVEKRYYTTKFWASEPYPQPAGVRVKARIAWDGSFDVGEAIDGVYDSMGRKVEGKERIRVTLRDKGYGELEWECSGVPAGVYFILLRWAGGSESVPVVVE